jgi:hypothetical protein
VVANVRWVGDDCREAPVRRSQNEIAYHDPLKIARRQSIAFSLPQGVSIQFGSEEIYPAAFFFGYFFRGDEEGPGPNRRIEDAFGAVR